MKQLHPRTHRLREYLHLRPWRRHSLVLGVAGVAYFLIGYSYLRVPLTEDRRGALGLALSYVGMSFWGTVFMLVGLLAILSARWPPASETWGYTMLGGVSAVWSAMYLFTWIFSTAGAAGNHHLIHLPDWWLFAGGGHWLPVHIPATFIGVPDSTPNTVILWALFGFLWWAISGLVNPKDIPLVEE